MCARPEFFMIHNDIAISIFNISFPNSRKKTVTVMKNKVLAPSHM